MQTNKGMKSSGKELQKKGVRDKGKRLCLRFSFPVLLCFGFFPLCEVFVADYH